MLKELRMLGVCVVVKMGPFYVGSMGAGKVYALKDLNGDFEVDETIEIAEGLNYPNGVAIKDGDLYIAEINQISVIRDIQKNLKSPTLEMVYDSYPTDRHHGWKYIEFGPDGMLYVPVGAPCNVCDEEDPYSSITKLNIESKEMEVHVRGVRNSVGFDWDPQTNEMWFTDNGRDRLGDDIPGDELNKISNSGEHFGFPFCHQGNIPDPKFGEDESCDSYAPPALTLGPHVAALGMKFYRGSSFPSKYHNSIFIPEHGSWNRTDPIGYRITLATENQDGSLNYEIFASGWLTQDEDVLGRPVDLLELPDGSLLLSDDHSNCIYRISYKSARG